VSETTEVRFERRGASGLVTLDRPKAINSLTWAMVDAMRAQLREWAADDAVRVVAITGAGEKGLCAGGDVVSVRRSLLDGDPDAALAFFDTEYDVDALIGTFPVPTVAFMDGVCMGGGIGIGGHASLRLVTERTKIAMPETKIGFFPDVGGLHLLAAAPGELGTHLALTSTVATGADAVMLGMADVLVSSEHLPGILEGLASGEVPAPADLGSTSHPAPLEKDRAWIDACYAGDDAAAILTRLEEWDGEGADRAHEAAAAIRARSPFSVCLTLAALRRAARLGTLEAVLDQDRALARVFVEEPDFREGVRALLVDKSNDPHWRHASVADVPRTDLPPVLR